MATPKWFDANVYMQNKLAQLKAQEPDANWSWDNLYDAFRDAGFVGEEGQYEHFVKFGAAEEVAPNAYFDADEYYAAKAKQYYEEELKQEFTGSEEQIANVKNLIKTAGMNAWTHYQQFGSAEGVNPSNAFDASDYCAAKAKAMNAAGQKDPDGNDWTAESIAKAIDDAGMSVLEHYMTYAGTGEGEVASGATYPVADDDQVVVPNPGETVVVDGSATTYTGTAGDDTFYLKTDEVLQEYDTLDGGEGNDTLILEDQALGSGTIKNIENLVVRDDGKNDAKTYDLSAFSSSFTLESGKAKVDNVTSQKLAADGTATRLDVTMADDQTSVELISTSTDDVTFSVSGDKLESMNLTTTGNTTLGDGDTNTVKNVAITALGDAAITLTKLNVLENVTVTGAGAVELKTVTGESVKSVDATDNTGGVTVDLSTATKAAFTGGDGDDSLKLGDSAAAHTLGAGDDTVEITKPLTSKDFSVDGGEGTDTLMMTADTAAKFSIGDVVKNFEILELSGSTEAAKVDMADFGDINYVVVGGALSDALTIDNVDSDGTIEFTAGPGSAVTVKVTDAEEGESDVLNVTIAADKTVDAGTLTVSNVETVNITADDTNLPEGEDPDAQHSLNLNANVADAVVISGDAQLTLDLTAANKVEIIDASTNTGGVSIKNNLDYKVTFKGSAGNDSISALALTAEPATADAVLTFDDFEAGDTIKMGATASGDLTELIVSSTDNWASIMDKIGDGDQVWFQYGGNTYVAVSGTTGFGLGNDDYIVKLSGTDIDLTDASFASGTLSLPDVEGA
ncbi:hypothetical protein [Desulfovibrio piger]|uniref:hypothetical protein n=1 Tax=Desulfovibrio piger TaxID=901 RepID=UPI00195EC64A|nr:hypothetical protein [Desulfovibrio piger]MBM6835425.1 hypothetical protein [Desulfovibrio piger]